MVSVFSLLRPTKHSSTVDSGMRMKWSCKRPRKPLSGDQTNSTNPSSSLLCALTKASERQTKFNPSTCEVHKSIQLRLLMLWCLFVPRSKDVIELEVMDRLSLKESSQLGVQSPCYPKAQSLACCGSFQCHLHGFSV